MRKPPLIVSAVSAVLLSLVVMLAPGSGVLAAPPAVLTAAATRPQATSGSFTSESGPTLERIAGKDRYATAAEISKWGWTSGCDSVVLCTGQDFPDALAAAPLAASSDAPLLLTAKTYLPVSTVSEIKRLGASSVTIVGGTDAVSLAVVAELSALGITTDDITRIGGSDRYATSALIADQVTSSLDCVWGVIVASGTQFADSVSVTSLAAALRAPILLTRPDSVPAVVQQTMDRLDPAGVLIVGGTSAVSADVASGLPGVRRIGGADRYETSALIADFEIGIGFSASDLVVASGEDYPDGLVAGVWAGQTSAPVLLCPASRVASETADWVGRHRSSIERVYVIGGAPAISAGVCSALEEQAVTRLTSDTRVVDLATASTVATVASDGLAVTFTGWTAQLQSLQVGNVLVAGPCAGAPSGFAGRVMSIDDVGSGVVVTMSEVGLNEIFRDAGIEVPMCLDSSGSLKAAGFLGDIGDAIVGIAEDTWSAIKDEGMSSWEAIEFLATGDLDLGFELSESSLNWNKSIALGDDPSNPIATMDAKVGIANVLVRFGLLVDDYTVDFAGAQIQTGATKITPGVTPLRTGSYSYQEQLKNLGKKTVVVCGVPVVFNNRLYFRAGVDVSKTYAGVGSIPLGECSMPAGMIAKASYDKDDGTGCVMRVDTPSVSAGASRDFAAGVDMDVWAGLRIEMRPYDKALAPYGEIRAVYDYTVDETADSSSAWRASGVSLNIAAGLDLTGIPGLGKDIEAERELWYRYLIWDSGPMPSYRVTSAKLVSDKTYRVTLDGPGTLDANSVQGSDFGLPGDTLTLVSVAGDVVTLKGTKDLSTISDTVLYMYKGAVCNTLGTHNAASSGVIIDLSASPIAVSAYTPTFDTVDVTFKSAADLHLVADATVNICEAESRRHLDEVTDIEMLPDARTLRLHLNRSMTQGMQYELLIWDQVVRDSAGFTNLTGNGPRFTADYSETGDFAVTKVDTSAFPHVTLTFDSDAALDRITGTITANWPLSSVSISGAHQIELVVAAHTSKDELDVQIPLGAVRDADGKVSKASSGTWDFSYTWPSIESVNVVDATHFDVHFNIDSPIQKADASKFFYGDWPAGVQVIGEDTVRVECSRMQMPGEVYPLCVYPSAITDADGRESDGLDTLSFTGFPSPQAVSAWATDAEHVRLEFSSSTKLDPTSIDASKFAAFSNTDGVTVSVLDAVVSPDGHSVLLTLSPMSGSKNFWLSIGQDAVADLNGSPCVSASRISYQYAPPLISAAWATGSDTVALSFYVVGVGALDPTSLDPGDFRVVSMETSAVTSVTSVKLDDSGVRAVLSLPEVLVPGARYRVECDAGSFTDDEGTPNYQTEAPFDAYDAAASLQAVGKPSGELVQLLVNNGMVVWSDNDSESWSTAAVDASGTVMLPQLPADETGLGEGCDPKAVTAEGDRVVVWRAGNMDWGLHVYDRAAGTYGPVVMLDDPCRFFDTPTSMSAGKVFYAGMSGGLSWYDCETGEQGHVAASGVSIQDPVADGRRVVYTRLQAEYREVWFYDLDTDVESLVATADVDQRQADISGERVVYIRDGDVWIYDLGSNTETRLTDTSQLENAPAIDGNTTVFERRDDAASDSSVYALDVSTGVERLISQDCVDARMSRISGSDVVFISGPDTGSTVWLRDLSKM